MDIVKLGIISKNTILKAIHNVLFILNWYYGLGIISKNTILKAIHNGVGLEPTETYVGNYK